MLGRFFGVTEACCLMKDDDDCDGMRWDGRGGLSEISARFARLIPQKVTSKMETKQTCCCTADDTQSYKCRPKTK